MQSKMAQIWQFLVTLITLVMLLPSTSAIKDSSGREYITYQDTNGQAVYLAEDRKPSLYTGNFGSCLQDSLVDVTRFDASYYHDNMTVIFDIQGITNLTREAVMIYIGVFAYGESRFELPFDPCKANIYSMCPVKNNVTITASGQIPLAQSDVANIPEIAYSIPDFEGQAILRIFSNRTQSEIACYSAVVTNGATFSQPASVGTILGLFTIIAILASFLTAIYGTDLVTMRTHHAHSLSVSVVFAVFHHIFFTGALSMNWPSVLVAFWSNYAWSAGIIKTENMQDSFDKLTRNNRGNISTLGAAGSGTWASNVGGGFDIHQIYKRSQGLLDLIPSSEHILSRRATSGNNNITNTPYMGHLVRAGLPLPGNYSGFAGTLYKEYVPASNAFLTFLVWFIILLVIVSAWVPLTKLTLDQLIKFRVVKTQRLEYFRRHWLGYTGMALLRTCFISFFAIMFFTLFQFSYGGVPGVLAIAAIFFIIFFAGTFGIAFYAFRTKLQNDPEPLQRQFWRVLGRTKSTDPQQVESVPVETVDKAGEKAGGTKPSIELTQDLEQSKSIHENEHYMKRFGWLVSRYRKSKWWFFSAWLTYEFIRACFFAGASGHAMTQVFGLLVVEILAFVGIIWARPFEGQRLNVIVVYLLGFSKVTTVALSAAFDVRFALQRITTTVIGVVIIVIQGILTICLLCCILSSAVTSYFSVTRYREEIRPKGWNKHRERYFKHLETAPHDRSKTPRDSISSTLEPSIPKDPYFSVTSVRRAPKIEDEDPEFLAEIAQDSRLMSGTSLHKIGQIYNEAGASRGSRVFSTTSLHSSNLPYAAKLHRASWSTRDLHEFIEDRPPTSDLDAVRPLSMPLRSRSARESMSREGYGIPGFATHPRTPPSTFSDELARPGSVSPPFVSAANSPAPSRSASLSERLSMLGSSRMSSGAETVESSQRSSYGTGDFSAPSDSTPERKPSSRASTPQTPWREPSAEPQQQQEMDRERRQQESEGSPVAGRSDPRPASPPSTPPRQMARERGRARTLAHSHSVRRKEDSIDEE